MGLEYIKNNPEGNGSDEPIIPEAKLIELEALSSILLAGEEYRKDPSIENQGKFDQAWESYLKIMQEIEKDN